MINKNRVASVFFAVFLLISAFTLSTGAFAVEVESKDKVLQEKFKKFTAFEVFPVDNNQVVINDILTKNVYQNIEFDELDPLSIDVAKELDLKLANNWSTSFILRGDSGEHPDTVNIKVSNVTSGKYKVLITSLNGYQFASLEQTGEYSTVIAKGSSDDLYTVLIINTGIDNVIAKAHVSSYIK
ncbi:hypothetical protein [Caldalkalibacillus mannanilyticus]|uniref:hypothetical protein n=1 Tax=Caldalkalibacillus mannanilyticus TaxID=1418 RepID=UPI0004683BF2|nr:hypothetical protein [Caldalkalibacillus mannanilyticus]